MRLQLLVTIDDPPRSRTVPVATVDMLDPNRIGQYMISEIPVDIPLGGIADALRTIAGELDFQAHIESGLN